MCSLCILDTNPLSNILFVNIFSQSLACLFIFLMAAFKKQIFWILMKTNILFFLLWIMFLVMIRSLCLFQIYKVFLLCLFLFQFLLEYGCFTLLCLPALHNIMNQPYTYRYPLPFGLPSHLGHPSALGRVPCSIQYVPISCLFYT